MKLFISSIIAVVFFGYIQLASANQDTNYKYKLWVSDFSDNLCAINSDRLLKRLFQFSQSHNNIELWINGRPKGLTLKSTIYTKYLTKQGVCLLIISTSIVDFKTAGGMTFPTKMDVYSNGIPTPFIIEKKDIYNISDIALDKVIFQLIFYLEKHEKHIPFW